MTVDHRSMAHGTTVGRWRIFCPLVPVSSRNLISNLVPVRRHMTSIGPFHKSLKESSVRGPRSHPRSYLGEKSFWQKSSVIKCFTIDCFLQFNSHHIRPVLIQCYLKRSYIWLSDEKYCNKNNEKSGRVAGHENWLAEKFLFRYS